MLLVALVREVGDDAKMVWQLLPLVDVVYRSRGEVALEIRPETPCWEEGFGQ